MSVGERLHAAMKGRTITSLAKEAGVSRRTVQRILRGKQKSGPDLDTMNRLARVCQVPATALAFGDEE